MRFLSLFLVSGFVTAAFSLLEDAVPGPEIVVTATFPEDNPFSQIVNGEKNLLNLLVENKSEQNVTLLSIAGSFHDSSGEALVKNLTTLPLGFPLFQGGKIQFPYQFHSEIRTGDVRLLITLSHTVDGETLTVTAFDDILTVVEPPVSWLDYRVITTYLITAAGLGTAVYFSFVSFFAGTVTRKSSGTSRKQASIAVTQAQANSGGYDDEWIPEHHRKKAKSGKRDTDASGDDRSGSGSEVISSDGMKQRRKGKKA